MINQKIQTDINSFEEKCKIKTNVLNSLFEEPLPYEKLGDYCDIGNGMVSGLDKAFQLPDNLHLSKDELDNTLKVIKAKDISQYFNEKNTNYIFLNGKISSEYELAHKFPDFYYQLSFYKESLKKRYNYGKDLKYWDWFFLRNYKLFTSNNDKVFVPCKERITKKHRFRFSYAEKNLIPTQDVTAIYKKQTTRESIYYILALLNSSYVFNWLKYKGIRKGDIVEFSEKPISIIPYRPINFTKVEEKDLHDGIVLNVKEYIETKNSLLLKKIDFLIDNLIGV